MSVIKDAVDTMREVLKLVDDVKRSTGAIDALTVEVRDIDRRLSRLEGKLDAVMAFGGRIVSHVEPPALTPPSDGG